MKVFALLCTVVLFTAGCDSTEEGKDDVLRIINSLDEANIRFSYSSSEGGGSGSVTLEHEVGPGSETIVNVSYIENDVFTFTAEKGGLEGIARCQVGPLAVGSGAADLLVYRTQIDPTTVIFEIDCAANWSGELPVD